MMLLCFHPSVYHETGNVAQTVYPNRTYFIYHQGKSRRSGRTNDFERDCLLVPMRILWHTGIKQGEVGVNSYRGMFFCDVDGTILPHGQHTISESFFAVVHEARAAGFLICISSGRFHRSLLPLFAPVAQEVVFSASNGCMILYQGRQLMPNHSILPQDARMITETLENWGAIPMLSGIQAIHLPRSAWEQQKEKGYLAKGYTQTFDAFSDVQDTILQITAVCKQDKQEILRRSRELWENRYLVVTTGKELFDICPTSKGESLLSIADYFSVPRSSTYAFGDDENDIPMLRSAGKGYIMHTARDSVAVGQFETCHDLVDTIRFLIDSV